MNKELFYPDEMQLDELQKAIAAFELDRILIPYYLTNNKKESGEDPVRHKEKLLEIRFWNIDSE